MLHKQPEKLLKKAVIFDFDGTLANTKPYVIQTLNDYVKQNNLPVTISDLKDFISVINNNKFYLNYKLLGLRSNLKNQTLNCIESNIANVKIDVELIHVLDQLHKNGYVLGILTANRETTVAKFLSENHISQYFHFIRNCKSKHVTFKHLTTFYQLDLENLFYVCDETADIENLKSLANTIAVTWGYDSELDLYHAHPHYLVNKPCDIIQVVEDNDLHSKHDHHFNGNTFANFLVNILRNEQPTNFSKALQRVSEHKFQTTALRRLLDCFDSVITEQDADYWCQLAILFATHNLFTADGVVHCRIAELFSKEELTWSHEEKQSLLQTYIFNFILRPLQLYCGEKTVKFNIDDKLRKKCQALCFSEQSLTSALTAALPHQHSENNIHLNDVFVEFNYYLQHYRFNKALSRYPIESNVYKQGQIVLTEADRLRNPDKNTMDMVASCLSAATNFVTEPNPESVVRCRSLVEKLAQRSYFGMFKLALDMLVKTLLSCLGNRKAHTESTTNVSPGNNKSPLTFFQTLRYLPIKNEVDTLTRVCELRPKNP